MYARVTTLEADVDKLDAGVQIFREGVLKAADGAEGFEGGLFLVDREGGKVTGMTFWTSREALDAGVERLNAARQQAIEAVNGRSPTLTIYEVAENTLS